MFQIPNFMKVSNLKLIILSLLCISCNKDYDNVTIISEAVVSVENFIETVEENKAEGASLGAVSATTTNGTLAYSIISQEPEDAISINPETGELSIADASVFDYEVNTEVTGVVEAKTQGASKTLVFTINITNVLDPDIKLLEISPLDVKENSPKDTLLTTVNATTTEGDIVYALESPSVENALIINSASGEITIADATLFDYETIKTITVTIKASVGDIFETTELLINITDIDDALTINSVDGLTMFLQSCRWDIEPGSGSNKIIFETGGNLALNFSLHGLAEWKIEDTADDGVLLFIKYGAGDNWDLYEVEQIDDITLRFNCKGKVGERVPIDFVYLTCGTIWKKPC